MKTTKNCVTCGKLFEKKINCSKKNWELARYCSHKCLFSRPVSPMKGKTWIMKEEQKEHLRKVLKGRTCNSGRTHFKKGISGSPETQFKKGFQPWNTGKKNPHFAGSNNPNWRGGVYPLNYKVRHSVAMKRWKMEVFKRDNYQCVLCSKRTKPGQKVTLHADHYPETFSSLMNRLNFSSFEEAINSKELWDIALGRTLCRECHRKTDTYGVNLKLQI